MNILSLLFALFGPHDDYLGCGSHPWVSQRYDEHSIQDDNKYIIKLFHGSDMRGTTVNKWYALLRLRSAYAHVWKYQPNISQP